MDTPWEYFQASAVQNFRNLALIFIILYLLKHVWDRYQFVEMVNRIPQYRYPFYQFMGHGLMFLQQRIYKRNAKLPTHVYDFELYAGYLLKMTQPPKKGISMSWQFGHPVIFCYTADAFEMILSKTKEQKKSWQYDFLHPWIGTGLLTSHGDKWRSRRKLLTEAFHFNILKNFVSVFNQESRILVGILDRFTQQEFVDIVPYVTRCSLDIICESILGKNRQSQTKPTAPYEKAVHAITAGVFDRIFTPWRWNDTLFKLLPSGWSFYKYIKLAHDFTSQIVSERKSARLTGGGPDSAAGERGKRALLDLLLDEHLRNNSIGEEGIREEVETFTFAGHDTTSAAISWALYMVGLHPWIQDKVHQELDVVFGGDEGRDATAEDIKDLKYLDCVVKETLRLFPSVPIYARDLTTDLEFEGYALPKGSSVVMNAFCLHRDPDMFPDPERFLPERFLPENCSGRHPFAYLPFSGGARNCIGQKFAVMEVKAVLLHVLRRFKVRSLDPRDRINLVDDTVLRPLMGLKMQIRRRDQPFDFHKVYYYPKSVEEMRLDA